MDAALLTQAMDEKTVFLDLDPFKDKDSLFRFMCGNFKSAGKISSDSEFLEALYRRENTGSTYMGNMIAVPHGKSASVKEATVGFCRLKEPMNYESCGEKGPVKMIFMLAVPSSTVTNDYLKILSSLARLLMHEDFIDGLQKSKDYKGILNTIKIYFEKYNV